MRVPKQGLGYNPRNAKNGATPPKKIIFVQEGHKVDVKAKENVVNGEPQRATLIINLRGNLTHPMCYVRALKGMCMLNMLVLVMVMLIDGTQFGYQRILLLMLRDPLLNGFLNKRLDFVGLCLRWSKMGV